MAVLAKHGGGHDLALVLEEQDFPMPTREAKSDVLAGIVQRIPHEIAALPQINQGILVGVAIIA